MKKATATAVSAAAVVGGSVSRRHFSVLRHQKMKVKFAVTRGYEPKNARNKLGQPNLRYHVDLFPCSPVHLPRCAGVQVRRCKGTGHIY